MSDAIGRSVRLFLVDGKSTGLITAEIMNWTDHVLTNSHNQRLAWGAYSRERSSIFGLSQCAEPH